MTPNQYFIGIMSGTSLDGIDVVISDFNTIPLKIIAQSHNTYPEDIKKQIDELVNSTVCSLDLLCQLDVALSKLYAKHTLDLLKKHNLNKRDIIAVGCHGQTIKHSPSGSNPYTLQIGDPNCFSALTGITTVADFRRKDVALNGQGAPLTPSFHQYAFSSPNKNRAIINIGGIANVTILPKDSNLDIIGYDTGPGNTLMDHFCNEHFNRPYDKDGLIAASGSINQNLLNFIIQNEPFFHSPIPKSTGTDFFNLDWYKKFIIQVNETISLTDQLATLNELTAYSISHSLKKISLKLDEVYFCGGGAHNQTLLNSLQKHTEIESKTTEELNIHPDWVEACAFSWFAKNTIEKKPSSFSTVTSASRNSILGGLFYP